MLKKTHAQTYMPEIHEDNLNIQKSRQKTEQVSQYRTFINHS